MKSELFHIFLQITDRCYQNCPFCEADLNRLHHMDLAEFKEILNKRTSEHNGKPLSINIGGGEHLFHEDLFDFLQACRDLSMKNGMIQRISLFTNGIELGNPLFFQRLMDFLALIPVKLSFIISTTVLSGETMQGISNLLTCKYQPRSLVIKAVISKDFLAHSQVYINQISKIIRIQHDKNISFLFRFINLKNMAKKNAVKATPGGNSGMKIL